MSENSVKPWLGSLQDWIRAALIVSDAENMDDGEVIPTWPDFIVDRYPDKYPQLTIGALREWRAEQERMAGVDLGEIHMVLRKVWARELSADDGLDEIESIVDGSRESGR